jgi:hypothetical protein
MYSQSAKLVQSTQDTLPRDDSNSSRSDEAVGLANQAIAMLRRAVETRAISNRRVLEWLKISSDYEPLRSTQEFREILDSVDRQLQVDHATRMAWSLARAGEHDRARIMAEKLVSPPLEEIEKPRIRYNQACIYSRCYDSARRSDDTSIPYLQLSIDCLKECARLDFLDTDGVSRLQVETDLDPIRQTEDFQVFLGKLKEHDTFSNPNQKASPE